MRESDQSRLPALLLTGKKFASDAFAFLVYTFAAFAIIFLLIRCIFLIRPKDAHVYAELGTVEPHSALLAADDLTAGVNEAALQSVDKVHNPAFLEKGGEQPVEVLVTDFFGNNDYSAYVSAPLGASIRITLAESDEADRWHIGTGETIIVTSKVEGLCCQIGIKGDVHSMRFKDASLVKRYQDSGVRHNGVAMPADQTVLSDSTAFKFEDKITVTLDNCVQAYVLNDNGSETPIRGDMSELSFPIENNDIPSVKSDDADESIYHQTVANEITFNLVSDNSSAYLASFFPSNYVFESNSVNRLSATSSGQLTMSYTPQPNEYSLQGQELAFSSAGSQLKCTYNPTEGTIQCQGYVQTATLSGSSLFPSFENWFFSNAYIAPLTLISSVFSALTLLTSFRKERRKNNTDDQSPTGNESGS